MIQDNNLQLSSAQAVTASAASTNYIDLTGPGEQGLDNLHVCITCNVSAASGGGAATVQFQLQNDSSSGFGTKVTVNETDAIPQASLVAGMAPIYLPVPPGTTKEFLRLNYNVASGPLTAGSFTASIVHGADVEFFGAVRDQS